MFRQVMSSFYRHIEECIVDASQFAIESKQKVC